jgi:hypothetical protein
MSQCVSRRQLKVPLVVYNRKAVREDARSGGSDGHGSTSEEIPEAKKDGRREGQEGQEGQEGIGACLFLRLRVISLRTVVFLLGFCR